MDFEEACDRADVIEFSLTGKERLAMIQSQIDVLAHGEDGRAMFLCRLAEFLTFDKRYAEARQAYRDALADGGPTIIDPRVGLLDIDITSGEVDHIDAHLTELLAASRAGELTGGDCEWVGEVVESVGRYKDAHRWFTIPLRDLDPGDIDSLPLGSLNGRYRVRRQLGLPMDRYDDATIPAREAYIAARGLAD